MIEIKSYQGINGIAFGSNENEAISLFGQPIRQNKNREQEKELFYPNLILRYDSKTNQLREITLLPKCDVEINGTSISWDENFLNWLASEDNDLQETLGFILSLRLGIATSGFHDDDESQKAIHFFRHGDWDMFKKRMKPFKWP